MRGAVVEQLQSWVGWILTFPLCYHGYVDTNAERTWVDLPFVEDNDCFGVCGFEAGGKLGVGPICCGADLLPLRLHSATANMWSHVMICVEAYFLLASSLRMCERTFMMELNCNCTMYKKNLLTLSKSLYKVGVFLGDMTEKLIPFCKIKKIISNFNARYLLMIGVSPMH